MTTETVPEQVHESSAVLRVGTGPLAAPMLGRVVAMMLARAGCPVDRLDDALTVCDALSAHAPAYAANGHVRFTVLTHPDGLELRVGALVGGGGRRLLSESALPGVGPVIEPIVDELRIEPAMADGEEELILAIGFPALPPKD